MADPIEVRVTVDGRGCKRKGGCANYQLSIDRSTRYQELINVICGASAIPVKEKGDRYKLA